MPVRSGTSHISGRNFLNRGDQVDLSGYVPSGMRKSRFSIVRTVIVWPESKVRWYCPQTQLGLLVAVRVRMMVMG